jgi:hypothetical protein
MQHTDGVYLLGGAVLLLAQHLLFASFSECAAEPNARLIAPTRCK